MEKLGIENLKIVAKVGVELGEKFEKALEDDKVTFWEAIGLVPKLKDVLTIVKNRSDIVEEFKDLDDSERAEIVQYVKSELDLNNDKLESLIENSLAAVVKIVDAVQDLVVSYKIFGLNDVSLTSVGGGGPEGDPDGDGGKDPG